VIGRRDLAALVGRARSPHAREPKREVKRPSSSSEAYFLADGTAGQPLLVVYHIQKTAGTALREVVRANLPPAELELGEDLRDLRYQPRRLIDWHRAWYEGLPPERRARLCCVMSHAAGYLLPALDRPAEALVLVREPVDRVLSFYWEKRRNFLRGRDPQTPFNLLEKVYAPPSEKGPPQAWPQFFNWQSRCLLSVFDDVSDLPASAGPPPDADRWRQRLRELVDGVFLVGVQDRLAEYVAELARRYGWRDAAVPRSGVNRSRPPLESAPEEVRERIRAYNWLDAELYELCRVTQERREAELPRSA
jgi:hypothetical protein